MEGGRPTNVEMLATLMDVEYILIRGKWTKVKNYLFLAISLSSLSYEVLFTEEPQFNVPLRITLQYKK